jgi:hypothetical protein
LLDDFARALGDAHVVGVGHFHGGGVLHRMVEAIDLQPKELAELGDERFGCLRLSEATLASRVSSW